ncbi:MAG TPA: sulfite exporter TauE/SafE family protein [Aliiroseovarius sp.]|nr:sulfite exporter TauE/SafE family protein [Aliiroseovarius sp.]
MHEIFGLAPYILALAFGVTLVAGFVKGAVGFAMPMIMISGMGSFIPAETALAALIVPTVATNAFQAVRGGWRAVRDGVWRYRRYLSTMLLLIALSSQLVSVLPQAVLLLVLGVPVVLFTLVQLAGWRLTIPPARRNGAELGVGAIAGALGGVSGVWGPPTVMFLTAINAPRNEQMRVQGVIYGLGAVVLFLSHLKSGVLNAHTVPLSIVMLVPSLAGLWLGFALHDRLDQARFRKLTLIVLAVAGLNLIRRGVGGL